MAATPQDANAHVELALSLLRARKGKEASAEIDAALKIDPALMSAHYIAAKLGAKVELLPVTTANRIPYLQTKKADLVISTLGKNPEREKVIDFTVAYSPFYIAVFGPKTIAIKTAPAILKPAAVEKLLVELLDGLERETQVMNIDGLKKKIAATVSHRTLEA